MKQFLLFIFVLLFIGACNSPNCDSSKEVNVGDVLPTETFKEIRLINIEPIEISTMNGDEKSVFGFDRLCTIPLNMTATEEVVAKNKNFVALRISYTGNWLGSTYCPNGAIYLDETENLAKRKYFFQNIEKDKLERQKMAEELLGKR